MNVAAAPAATPAETATAYHERTKHSLKAYAAGPETLDWDGQPNPFRTFEGADTTALPLLADQLETPFADLSGRVAPAPLTLGSVATLLELSMGLTAWKELGPDRWAVRANPSSGNLHPTEAYVIAQNVPALESGLHHYVSRDHALELRCASAEKESASVGRLWIGLSSIEWREAWKYGERAFRYCQLDTGHALAAFRYAAAALGWRVRLVSSLNSAALAALMGLDRDGDFAGAEREEPELLMAIDTEPGAEMAADALPALDGARWAGKANVLDRHPMYRWPVIGEVSRATRVVSAPTVKAAPEQVFPPRVSTATARAADVILNRRSAQRFEAKFHMPRETLWSMLDALLPRRVAPFDVWNLPPALHPVVFVHKVEGLDSGVYALPRRTDVADRLHAAMRDDFEWTKPDGCPDHLPFYRLARTDARGVIRTLSCHQAIAGDSCFSLGMLATFDDALGEGASRYRQLFWEAGLIGQVLYLEAEAAGLRGTGIGCYFDDDFHRLLGLDGRQFQSMYHFTVGRPMTDARIVSSPAYPGRKA